MATLVKKKLKKLVHLCEDISYQEDAPRGKLRVDREKCIVYDVKILGFHSKNVGGKRRYLPEGVDPAIYENKMVNIDHPGSPEEAKAPRKFAARHGKVTGLYKNEKGLFAKEYRYNPEHSMTPQFLWFAENMPEAIGYSQNAYGDVWESADGEIVEKVNEVRSIDIVTDPATTNGLFEGVNAMSMKTRKMVDKAIKGSKTTKKKKLKEGYVKGIDDKYKKKDKDKKTGSFVKEEDEDEELEESDDETEDMEMEESDDEGMEDLEDVDGDGDADLDLDGDGEEGEEGDLDLEMDEEDPMGDEEAVDGLPGVGGMGEEGGDMAGIDITEEMATAADKIFRADGLSAAAKLKGIVKLLKLHHKMKGLEEGMTAKTLPEAVKVLKKSKNTAVRLVLKKLDEHEVKAVLVEKRKKANELCDSQKLPTEARTEVFMRSLLECKDDRSMQELVDDRYRLVSAAGKTSTSQTPKSASGEQSALMEGVQEGKKDLPKTKEEEDKLFEQFERDAFQ